MRKFDKHSHIIYIEMVNEYLHFDNMGKLTASGRSTFWNEVNKEIERYDRGKKELLPWEKINPPANNLHHKHHDKNYYNNRPHDHKYHR